MGDSRAPDTRSLDEVLQDVFTEDQSYMLIPLREKWELLAEQIIGAGRLDIVTTFGERLRGEINPYIVTEGVGALGMAAWATGIPVPVVFSDPDDPAPTPPLDAASREHYADEVSRWMRTSPVLPGDPVTGADAPF